MIKKQLAKLIIQELVVEPTNSQLTSIDQLSEFLYNNNQNSLFILKGYAGTGKTLLVSTLVKVLTHFRIKSSLLAPTGRAAKVLSQYANETSLTIHKKIYRQQSTSDGTGRFVLDFNKASNTLFIVDEASMISNENSDASVFGSGRLLDDLIEYVYNGNNCRLMLVGDTAQLPPVGLTLSPALDPKVLEGYNMTVYSAILSDVVRQSSNSGILYNATLIRQHIKNKSVNCFFPIKIDIFSDIERLSGGNLIERISYCYDKYGEDETIVVTRSNKRANRFNEGIRKSILWRETELESGDLLMVVKNNYFWINNENDETDEKKIAFIANGDIAKVRKVRKIEELYGFRFANVTLQLLDYENIEFDCKIILDTLTIESASLSETDNRKLFLEVQNDYLDIKNKRKRWEKIKENEYFNALQVKYAYSVTCHKAQGGQWDAVFIDHGYLLQEMITIDFLRWFYTAFTRPKTKLFLVNFSKEFFGGVEVDN